MANTLQAVSAQQARKSWPRLRVSAGFLRAFFSIIGAAALWEIAGRTFLNNPLFFAPLSAVLVRMGSLWASGDLQRDIWVSFEEFILGFVLATVVGIGIGVVMAGSRPVREILDPWISMLYSTPFVALAPLLILWLGIGLASHVAVVFIVAVFPILINTYTGLANSDRDLIEVAQSFGARQLQIFAKVRFPGALPFIVAGLRQGIARGLVGVVVAELFGSHAGLGYLILVSGQSFDPAGLFAGILLFSLAGVGSVEAIRLVERRIAPWRAQDNDA